jgi:prephenate dehydratase
MCKIHIVGLEDSFTHDATKIRYPETHDVIHEYVFGKTHKELVTALLDKQIPVDDSAVVPLWNSNTGTVDMDRQTKTAELFLGKGGIIQDLWPQDIIFKLFLKGIAITPETKIFSVEVAKSQCSTFLNRNGLLTNDRFKGKPTTTHAAKIFLQDGGPFDGLLCGEQLLQAYHLTPLEKQVTNPNNYTLFSTFNKIPIPSQGIHKISLGCVVVSLDGNELPTEFIRYYKELVSMDEITESPNVLNAIPKILFILRYEESKALVLLEMDAGDYDKSPWPQPDIDSENIELVRLEFYDQVGRVPKLFTQSVSTLFRDCFMEQKQYVFYGYGDCYLWICPDLNIAVQGFNKELVRESAKTQVLHLLDLMDAGGAFLPATKQILECYRQDPANLKLTPTSEPDGP